ncbi:hybrid sensor histidine kinase/response regulator [Phenylobacterium sp.]|uniref:hybrid sensor histidine kinase/response regulator n=1 Tax=Phenylobacterium sp. TaxID=1871053 RepID=UPI002EDBA829
MAKPSDPSFETDALFLGLAEATLDCVAVLDGRGVVRFASDRAVAELGDTVAPGHAWADVWGQEHLGEVDRALAAARAGRPARLRTFRTRPGRSPEWWDTTIVRVPGAGQDPPLMAASRNITADIESRSLLETIVDHAPAVLFAKDVNDDRYIMINQAAEDFFDRSREEMVGRTPAEVFDAERAALIAQVDQEVLTTGRVYIEEKPHQTATSGERIFKTRIMATFGDEGPRHIIGVCEDVTDEREVAEALKAAADRAEAANRSKSEFLANMSHEIRTPLNGVVAVADVLARTELDGQQREMVEIVRSSGATLERLLSDVLDLARIESGAIEIQKEPFHLAEAIRGVAGLLSMRAQEKGVALDVSLPPEAETWVLSDVVRVKQIVTNLTSNAVKFTERGAVRIEVTCEGGEPGRPLFRLAVRDTGVGFEPANKDRVFGRFQQADGSITRRFGGTGLGLAISRELAQLMDGDLDCDSEPGVGSVFWVTLPLEITAAPVSVLDTVEAAEPAADQGPMRVLLADDHPTNRKVVELILQPLGVELLSVEDGRQAVEAYSAADFDVVLMDMQMPVMDGLAATRAIRQVERQLGRRRTPVLMLTANALPEHLELSRKAGADRHLSKPITAEKLIKALLESGSDAGEEIPADAAFG